MPERLPGHFAELNALGNLCRSCKALAAHVELLRVAIKQAVDASAAARGETVSQISVRTVLVANTAVNALQGTQYEYLPGSMLLRTVQTGVDVIEEESPVAIAAINVQPVYPDGFTLNDAVGPGEKINVKLRDTSGAQRIVNTIVRFTPL